MQAIPSLLALDFDGVICDGLIEYFQTAWQAYCRIWQPANPTPPEGLAEQFYRLRPVVETGWEMPVVLRSLLLGVSEAEILENWGAIAQAQIAADHLTPAQLSAAVDGYRDEWIAADLENWLSQHRFYPGMGDRLRNFLTSAVQVVIITTKEGRFVRQLLQLEQIDLPESHIFGKEQKQPKAETLRHLLQAEPNAHIWFIEDRLKTLQSIKPQPDLTPVQLFLADWGYNTRGDREVASQDDRIKLLSLEQFSQDFTHW
ncbi:HAD family hydrolase [Oscillatoria sp. FACHB-1407]|nr:HAD family hydrolase [Oscillatoria sp. FACHB-1407]